MKTLACVWALSALSGAFLAPEAMAWGNDGHRAVGAIADQLLIGTNAQKQVAAMLLPGETLETVSVWADCVKGSYCGPQTPEMVAYTGANPKHGEYHYTDIPFQNGHYDDGAVGSGEHDIVQSLKQAIAVLQGKGDACSNPHSFTSRQALLLIAHLAGDIHQPLHVGAAYVSKSGKFVVPETKAQIDTVNVFDARGGNNLLLDDQKLAGSSTVLIPPSAPKEGVAPATPAAAPKSATRPFHSYWDTTVVDYAMRRIGASSPAQFAQRVIGDKSAVQANTGDAISWPYQWANDTLAIAKLAYADLAPGQISQQIGRKGGHLLRLGAGSAAELSGAKLCFGEDPVDQGRVPPGFAVAGNLAMTGRV